MLKAIIRDTNENDKKYLENMDFYKPEDIERILTENMSVNVTDENGNSAFTLIEKNLVEKFGEDYIKTHAILKFDKILNEYTVSLSANDFYNDVKRFKPKTIEVKFIETEANTGNEIYQCEETKKYYMRQVASREPFAKWLSCYKHQGYWEDGSEIRANITFKHGDQTEKVTYDDWNGNAAYSNTFNENFNKDGGKYD